MGKPLPSDNKSAKFPLKPRKCSLNLKARGIHFGLGTRPLFGIFSPRYLRLNPSFSEVLPQFFFVVSFISGQLFRISGRATRLSGFDLESVKQRLNLFSFVTICGRCGGGKWHAILVNEQVNQDAFPLPSVVNAFTPALARGKKSRQRLQMSRLSSLHCVQGRGLWPVSVREYHLVASVEATDVPNFWKPTEAPLASHTNENP